MQPTIRKGCAHAEAVGGKRAGSFRSLTPFFRRYPHWPLPQPKPSRGHLPEREQASTPLLYQ